MLQARFEIDPSSKTWVIKSLSKKWKDWKSKLKTAHYITHTTDEERLADRDERVHPDQWAYLVSHWSSELAAVFPCMFFHLNFHTNRSFCAKIFH